MEASVEMEDGSGEVRSRWRVYWVSRKVRERGMEVNPRRWRHSSLTFRRSAARSTRASVETDCWGCGSSRAEGC